jgi:hypothetical protein
VSEYFKLVPVEPVQTIPGAEPKEPLCILNDRTYTYLREMLWVGELSEAEICASHDGNTADFGLYGGRGRYAGARDSTVGSDKDYE